MKDWLEEQRTGLVVGNASVSAGASPAGRLFQRIIWNPPCFEEGRNGMVNGGTSRLWFETAGKRMTDESLKWQVTEGDYPRYCAKTKLTDKISVTISAIAPVAPADTETLFLPAICLSVRFYAEEACEITTGFEWYTTKEMLAESYDKPAFLYPEDGWLRAEKEEAFIAFDGTEKGWTRTKAEGVFEASASLLAAGKREQELRIWFGYFPKEHRFRRHVCDIRELCSEIRTHFKEYEAAAEQWISEIPDVGDEKIRQYTRWYSQAAVLLTKSDVTGKVITMGYHELNQRDSYWTTYVHLYFWPKLEQKMIQESCEWQRPDGKIPTTIYPVYEREYDIDINEYFCLRIGRYFRFHRDWEFLRLCWPNFKKSVEYLLMRDVDRDYLPEQAAPDNPLCFWADWKDVKGIVGRKLAPHFVLLWLAVLKDGIYLAEALEEKETKEQYEQIYKAAYKKINLPASQGGLWQDGCYRERWYDGSVKPYTLIDQTVGMAFDVVKKSQAAEIYRELEKGETLAGIPETYPFRDKMEYKPGVYHNGGIWPFLVFVDCMGRYRNGYWQDAERLIRKIGYYDLEVPGDWAPNEYLNGITLENAGFEIQGWSAALFGAIINGAFQICRSQDKEVTVKIGFGKRDFAARLRLPEPFGIVGISRENGILKVQQTSKEGYFVTVTEQENQMIS